MNKFQECERRVRAPAVVTHRLRENDEANEARSVRQMRRDGRCKVLWEYGGCAINVTVHEEYREQHGVTSGEGKMRDVYSSSSASSPEPDAALPDCRAHKSVTRLNETAEQPTSYSSFSRSYRALSSAACLTYGYRHISYSLWIH